MRWLCLILMCLHGLYQWQPSWHQVVNPVLAALALGLLLATVSNLRQQHSLVWRSIARWQPPSGLQQQALRLGIMLFALQVDPALLLQTDPWLFGRLLLLITMVFAGAYWLGVFVFGLRQPQALLLTAGFSFCGTSAIFATQSVQQGAAPARHAELQPTPAELSQSLALVMLLGLLALTGYSLLAQSGWVNPQQLAWLIGSTAPEVSQAVAAAGQLGSLAALAVAIKLARVCLLVPYLLLLNQQQQGNGRAPLPWFILGFVALLLLQLQWPLSDNLRSLAGLLSQTCLMLAMLLTGLQTQWQDLRQCQARTLAFAVTVLLGLLALAWWLM